MDIPDNGKNCLMKHVGAGYSTVLNLCSSLPEGLHLIVVFLALFQDFTMSDSE
jgi:hypothetical protein